MTATDTPSEPGLGRFRRGMVQNAMKILGHEDAVHKLDPDHFTVISLRTPSRRVPVYRRGDSWRCRSDRTSNQDVPCSHILAVLIYEGIIERPDSSAAVERKSNTTRNHAIEDQAWQAWPTEWPRLLARLLREGLPVLVPEPKRSGPDIGGRPRAPLYALVYQAVARVALRQNLRASTGAMEGLDHRANNPHGGVSRSTLSRFLKDPKSTVVLEKLLALSTYPAAPYESLVHPDGTGVTEQHFTQFFQEKHGEHYEHLWNFAVLLWTYRYTLIASLRSGRGNFGEAQWLIPLLERAGLTLTLRELGADKAYNHYSIDEYLALRGIDSQIKVRDNANPTKSTGRKKAYKRRVERSRLDPRGFDVRANRRSNAESGNHALKAILGDQIYSKTSKNDPDAIAQRNEILCMALAYNLTRLIYLGFDQGIEIQFAQGAEALAKAKWLSLDELHGRWIEPDGKSWRLRDSRQPVSSEG